MICPVAEHFDIGASLPFAKLQRLMQGKVRGPLHGIPAASLYHRSSDHGGALSDFSECVPDLWIDVERGIRAPEMYEQVLRQKDGYALVLLHLEPQAEDEDDDERGLESTDRRFAR